MRWLPGKRNRRVVRAHKFSCHSREILREETAYHWVGVVGGGEKLRGEEEQVYLYVRKTRVVKREGGSQSSSSESNVREGEECRENIGINNHALFLGAGNNCDPRGGEEPNFLGENQGRYIL